MDQIYFIFRMSFRHFKLRSQSFHVLGVKSNYLFIPASSSGRCQIQWLGLTSWFSGFHRRSVPAATAIWPIQTTSKSSTSFTEGTFKCSSKAAGGSATSCETMGFNKTCKKAMIYIKSSKLGNKRWKSIKSLFKKEKVIIKIQKFNRESQHCTITNWNENHKCV